MKNKNILLIVALIIAVGLVVRLQAVREYTNMNTADWFLTRLQYLYENGRYMKNDSIGFAPDVRDENYPPFLHYFALGLFKMLPLANIILFARFLPMLIYVLICISGFIFMSRFYGKISAVIFVVIITSVNTGMTVTRFGYYTYEGLGVLLLLISMFFLFETEKKISKKNILFFTIFSTALLLDWTYSVIITLFAAIVLLFNLSNRKKSLALAAMIILPLIMAHLISTQAIGIKYSPINMFQETAASLTSELGDEKEYDIAISRKGAGSNTFSSYTKDYSILFGTVFIFLGILECIRKRKESEYRNILIFTIITIIMVVAKAKFRFLFLPFLAITAGIGGRWLYEYKSKKFVKRLKNAGKALRRKRNEMIFMLIVGIVFISILYIKPYPAEHAAEYTAEYEDQPRCKVALIYPIASALEINETFRITFKAENIGGTPLCTERSFGGLHIEVRNAEILDIRTSSEYTGTWQRPVNDSEPICPAGGGPCTGKKLDSMLWFETKFDCLKRGQTGYVELTIKPYAKPIELLYRCWIPGRGCEEIANETAQALRPDWKQDFWRSEECVQREPSSGRLCKVMVYAGHYEKQDFYCYDLELK